MRALWPRLGYNPSRTRRRAGTRDAFVQQAGASLQARAALAMSARNSRPRVSHACDNCERPGGAVGESSTAAGGGRSAGGMSVGVVVGVSSHSLISSELGISTARVSFGVCSLNFSFSLPHYSANAESRVPAASLGATASESSFGAAARELTLSLSASCQAAKHPPLCRLQQRFMFCMLALEPPRSHDDGPAFDEALESPRAAELCR